MKKTGKIVASFPLPVFEYTTYGGGRLGRSSHLIGLFKRNQVQCLLDPLHPARATSPCARLTGQAERG